MSDQHESTSNSFATQSTFVTSEPGGGTAFKSADKKQGMSDIASLLLQLEREAKEHHELVSSTSAISDRGGTGDALQPADPLPAPSSFVSIDPRRPSVASEGGRSVLEQPEFRARNGLVSSTASGQAPSIVDLATGLPRAKVPSSTPAWLSIGAGSGAASTAAVPSAKPAAPLARANSSRTSVGDVAIAAAAAQRSSTDRLATLGRASSVHSVAGPRGVGASAAGASSSSSSSVSPRQRSSSIDPQRKAQVPRQSSSGSIVSRRSSVASVGTAAASGAGASGAAGRRSSTGTAAAFSSSARGYTALQQATLYENSQSYGHDGGGSGAGLSIEMQMARDDAEHLRQQATLAMTDKDAIEEEFSSLKQRYTKDTLALESRIREEHRKVEAAQLSLATERETWARERQEIEKRFSKLQKESATFKSERDDAVNECRSLHVQLQSTASGHQTKMIAIGTEAQRIQQEYEGRLRQSEDAARASADEAHRIRLDLELQVQQAKSALEQQTVARQTAERRLLLAEDDWKRQARQRDEDARQEMQRIRNDSSAAVEQTRRSLMDGITAATGDAQRLTKERNELRQQLFALERRCHKAEDEAAALSSKADHLTEQLHTSQSETSAARAHIAELDQQVSSLSSDLTSSKHSIGNLEDQLSVTRRSLDIAKQECNRLATKAHADADAAALEATSLRQQLDQKTSALADAQSAIDTFTRLLDSERSSAEDAKRSHAEASVAVASVTQDAELKIRAATAATEAKIQDMKHAIEAASRKHEDLIHDLQRQLATAHAEAARQLSAQQEASHREISGLVASQTIEVAQMKAAHDALVAQLQARSDTLEATHASSLESLHQQHDHAVKALEDKHKQAVESLSNHHSAEMGTLKNHHREALAELRVTSESQSAIMHRLEQERDGLRSQVASLQADVASREAELAAAKQAVEDAVAAGKATEHGLSTAATVIDAQKQHLEQQSSALAAAETRIQTLSAEVSTVTAALSALRSESAARLEHLQSVHQLEMEATRKECEAAIKEANMAYEEVKGSVQMRIDDVIREQEAAMRKCSAECRLAVAAAESKLQRAEQALASSKAVIEASNKERMRRVVDAHAIEVQQLQERLANERARCEAECNIRLVTLQAELNTTIASKQAAVDEAEAQASALRAQLQAATSIAAAARLTVRDQAAGYDSSMQAVRVELDGLTAGLAAARSEAEAAARVAAQVTGQQPAPLWSPIQAVIRQRTSTWSPTKPPAGAAAAGAAIYNAEAPASDQPQVLEYDSTGTERMPLSSPAAAQSQSQLWPHTQIQQQAASQPLLPSSP